MLTRDNSLPQATPDLAHSADCTEAAGHLSFVSLREVYMPLSSLSKHNESSAGSEGAAISPEKQERQWKAAEAVQLRGKEKVADPPSGCFLGARPGGLLQILAQSLCPAVAWEPRPPGSVVDTGSEPESCQGQNSQAGPKCTVPFSILRLEPPPAPPSPRTLPSPSEPAHSSPTPSSSSSNMRFHHSLSQNSSPGRSRVTSQTQSQTCSQGSAG